MEQKLTVNKTINSWSCFPYIQRSIFLIGSNNTGRTTYAELIKRYIFNNTSSNLIYDNGKYILEGVISSKPLKLQTVLPSLYQKSNNRQQLKIIDTPSFICAPESKKWSLLQQRLTIQYMMSRTRKVGFLIFVDQKNTRANASIWRKALFGFLDVFRPEAITEELLDSISFVFTRCPPEMNQNSMMNRFKLFQPTLKGNQLAIAEKLFKNILEKNRIVLFKKVSANESEKEGVLACWSKIQSLVNYTWKKQHIKELTWGGPEGEKLLFEYLETFRMNFEYFLNTIKQIFQLQEINAGKIQQIKKNRPYTNKIIISEEVRKALSAQDKKIPKQFYFVREYCRLKDQFGDLSISNFNTALKQFIKFGFFLDEQDEYAIQSIFEGVQFIKLTQFNEFDLQNHINNFRQLFSEKYILQVLRKLILAENGNANKQFYEYATNIISSNFKDVPVELKEFYENCKKKYFKFSNPKQAMKMCLQELTRQKNGQKLWNISNDIASILRTKGMISQAGRVYRLIKNIGSALQCYKEVSTTNEQNAREYISYLTQIFLFQDAIRCCYEFASKFGYASRSKFSELLKINEEARRKYASEKKLVNIWEDTKSDGMGQIKKISNECMSNL